MGPLAALLRLEQQEGDEKPHGARRTPQRPQHPHSPSSDELDSGDACPGQPHGWENSLLYHITYSLAVMGLILKLTLDC